MVIRFSRRPKKRYGAREQRPFYRTNQYITAPEVRLIDEKGKQLGIVTREEALKKAQDLEIDLVEAAPKAQPPVCRLIDFKKFRYLQSRKAKEERKKTKEVETKEVRMGPFVASRDLEIRLSRIREFLGEGNRVKVSIWFSGRQITHPEFGHEVLKKVVGELKEIAQVQREAKFEGRKLSLILGKLAGAKKENKNAEGKNEKSSSKKV